MTTQSVVEPAPAPAPSRTRAGVVLVAWVVVLAVAGGVLGLALAQRIGGQASAEGSLLLTPLPGNALADRSGNLLVDLETESHLPSSDAVLRRVAADGQAAPGLQAMRSRLTVHVVPNSSIIVLRYRAAKQQAARIMVQRIAAATLAERAQRATVAKAAAQEVIRDKIAALEAEQKGVTGTASPALIELLSQRGVDLNTELADASDPVTDSGRLIGTKARGKGVAGKLRIVVLGGCVVLAAGLGWWVGRGPSRRQG